MLVLKIEVVSWVRGVVAQKRGLLERNLSVPGFWGHIRGGVVLGRWSPMGGILYVYFNVSNWEDFNIFIVFDLFFDLF